MKLMRIGLVYSFFFLEKFAFRAYNACNAILARSQTLYLLMRAQSGAHSWRISSFLALRLSHTFKKSEANDAYSLANWGQNFHESEKRKIKKKKNLEQLVLDSFSCASFPLLLSWAELFYNVCLYLIQVNWLWRAFFLFPWDHVQLHIATAIY